VDAVYLFGGAGDDELRHSLRSVANLRQVDRVVVSGMHPDWLAGDVLRVSPAPHPPGKFESAWANLVAAVRDPRVSDEFVLMNDDFFILEPVDVLPVLARCPWPEWRPTMSRGGARRRATAAALALLGVDPVTAYEGHRPLLVGKRVMEDVIPAVDAQNQRAAPVWVRTVYGNAAFGGRGVVAGDAKIYRHRDMPPDGAVFVSTSDQAWSTGRVGQWLRARFPNPCRHERR
jgi:hypothetical protein